MLTRLSIKNYALIDELQVDFEPGFNIITGETGAGKSIILGALSLMLGTRADSTLLRDPSLKCIVEGYFDIENYGLKDLFETNELDYESQTIFRRELLSSGKSRAFINDTPVNLKTMYTIGLKLIDIHSQHQNLELSNHQFQLKLIDITAGTETLLKEYVKLYSEYTTLQKLLVEKREHAAKAVSDFDYLQFQYNQLKEARLKENEQEELEEALERLTHAEEIKSALARFSNLLEGDNISLLSGLKESLNHLNRIREYFKESEELINRIESIYIELKDLAGESSLLESSIDFNEEEIQKSEERLSLIYNLEKKHNVSSIAELIDLLDKLEKELNHIADFDKEIGLLEKKEEQLYKALEEKSEKLSVERHKAFPLIEKRVVSILKELGMVHAKFQVSSFKNGFFTKNGKDSVNFLFSANKDTEPDEISKIASGGETSRLMLALKSLITDKKSLPTIIFDEIDSGISGEIALKMGTILKDFSKNIQVINITHLPQIAGKGNSHYLVYKYDNDQGTFTSIRKLNKEERVEELAKMVGGDNPTESAIKAANELLEL